MESTDCLIAQLSGGGTGQNNRNSDNTITSNTTEPLILFYVQCVDTFITENQFSVELQALCVLCFNFDSPYM